LVPVYPVPKTATWVRFKLLEINNNDYISGNEEIKKLCITYCLNGASLSISEAKDKPKAIYARELDYTTQEFDLLVLLHMNVDQ